MEQAVGRWHLLPPDKLTAYADAILAGQDDLDMQLDSPDVRISTTDMIQGFNLSAQLRGANFKRAGQ